MSHHRLRATAAGLGALTGGMLFAALSQLALASTAAAQPDNPFADIFSDIQASITTGQDDLSDGATVFANGEVPLGVDLDLTGVDNQLFAPEIDLTVDGFEALTGNPESGPFEFVPIVLPTDFDDGVAGAEYFLNNGESFFTSAVADFAAGDVSSGLANAADGTANVLVDAPNDLILGLIGSLVGGVTLVD